ncbi:hypothetical protein HYU09_02920 [Candidatus Woesearchaeota archaeon]|nr:hypothetical protein [Candidatus Woesearchaeota archaeon]
MENKPVPESYERIGQWYVNLAIPQNARDFLRRSFDAQLRGEVPDGDLYFHAKMIRNCLQVGIQDVIYDAVGNQNSKELESLIKNSNSGKEPGVVVDIARLWVKGSASQSKSSKTYAEHCVSLSTCEITPDPFVEINSYLNGVQVDAYKRTEDKGIITATRVLYTKSPAEFFIEQVKSGNDVSNGEILYHVKITIDCKTREARIDPAPS